MFMSDITRAAAHTVAGFSVPAALQTGLTAGTLVETATGWRGVETLRIGDRVHSYDGGLAAILCLDRRSTAPQSPLIHIPGGAFDTCSDLALPEDQHLLIETLADPELPDALSVLIPAAALVGFRGTQRLTLAKPIELITPLFAQAEAIYANSGTLFYCPAISHGPGRLPQGCDFTRLNMGAARAVLRRLDLRLSLATWAA